MPSLLNAAIGDYRLVDFLGAGGMGEVYRGVHSKIGRVVAIKVLTGIHRHTAAVERFLNEARIQARLQHRHIATLYDFLEFQGQPCIIMEYVDGQTLFERLQACGYLPLAEAIAVFQAVVEAISYIHEQQIVHRDIKSTNIKVNTAGEVKLLDFGIAKAVFSQNLTVTGNVVGTLQYLSPEQIQGKAADARSDIWSLGILLYEMVTGQCPFKPQDSAELLLQVSHAEYTPPSAVRSALPRGVEAIISRCLEKNPFHRYPSAQALLADVQHLARMFSMPQLDVSGHGKPAAGWKTAFAVAGDNWPITLSAIVLVFVLALGMYVGYPPPPVRSNRHLAL